jgi:hypothetical protein
MYTTSSSLKYKTYTNKDPGFHFSPDNIVIVPRAGFQINDKCPREYKLIIAECINNGWLKPIAHQPVHEHFMEELTK